VGTPGGAAVSYVPVVMVSRGLAFLRLLVVARLLGAAGKAEFGLYQPAQELVNWVVPVALLGLADVAERYASRFEREGRLGWWLRRQYLRLLGMALGIGAALLACGPWVARGILHVPANDTARGVWLVVGCAVTIVALAMYQHLAAVLRGVRAYGASAGLELVSAILFLLFAAVAAWRGGAVSLMAAYAGAVILAVLFYGWRLWRFVRTLPAAGSAVPGSEEAEENGGNFHGFAIWAFLRLLLMMTFSAVSVLGVGYLAGKGAQEATADYAMPYRIAQLLSYVAATVWASTYGIAARAWSHGQVRRAHVQLFRVGKWGAVLMTLIAVAVLAGRSILAAIEVDYANAIMRLLPPLLGVFLWFGLLTFCSLYSDLHETPWKGAMLWGSAVVVQVGTLCVEWHRGVAEGGSGGAKEAMILACALGTGFALLVLAPVMLWRPFRMSATAVPLAVMALAPLSLFAPAWGVDVVAIPVLLGAVGFVWVSGLLIRPVDRRAWRRWRGFPATRSPGTQDPGAI